MRRRNIQEAVDVRLASFSSSLSCVSRVPATLKSTADLQGEVGFTLATGRSHSVSLRSTPKLFLLARQIIQMKSGTVNTIGKHSATIVVNYSYQISTDEFGRNEIVAFHGGTWAAASPIATGPHLHIGSIVRPIENANGIADFHKRHIPTGVVPFSSVVRFLIEELGVEPIRDNWDEILANVLD